MKERYEVIKKLYPNYLILFRVKDKIKTINIDKEIIDIFGLNHIKEVNQIILNNLDIESINEYENNRYLIYYTNARLISVLNK
jgi:hypothetical protein